MTIRVLITRPREDAASLVSMLAAKGMDSVVEPLIDIVPVADATLDLRGVQAILLTSANGARALAALSEARALPVLAVGNATARAARAAGFASVESAGGDVADLARLAAARLDPDTGMLCHIAGSAVAGDLAGRLSAAGFTVRRDVLYEARTRDALSPVATAALRDGALDAVLFFSPRTAATFVTLVTRGANRLAARCDALAAICLSDAVAAAVAEVRWRAVHVAEAPTQVALVARLVAEIGTPPPANG